jgi:hypothetical protein
MRWVGLGSVDAFTSVRFPRPALDPVPGGTPLGEIASEQDSPLRFVVSFADPSDHPMPGALVEVSEGRFRYSVAEVGAPARSTRLSWRSRAASVGCDNLRVSARTRPTMEASAFFDG